MTTPGSPGRFYIGGSTGAATAANTDRFNRQLHQDERALAIKLAKESGGKYTIEQIEEALRASGNSARGETVTSGVDGQIHLAKALPREHIHDLKLESDCPHHMASAWKEKLT